MASESTWAHKRAMAPADRRTRTSSAILILVALTVVLATVKRKQALWTALLVWLQYSYSSTYNWEPLEGVLVSMLATTRR